MGATATLLLLLPLLVLSDDQLSPSPLPVCALENACAAQLRVFPVTNDDSSGFSGQEPLYDEFFQPFSTFDFTADPEKTSNHELCTCADNSTCEDADGSRSMHLNPSLSLIFCSPVKESFQRPCRGQRNTVRVIGDAHSTGTALSSVSQTFAFCNCPNGFQSESLESWGGFQISLSFRCA